MNLVHRLQTLTNTTHVIEAKTKYKKKNKYFLTQNKCCYL